MRSPLLPMLAPAKHLICPAPSTPHATSGLAPLHVQLLPCLRAAIVSPNSKLVLG
jgi:hypothetical protein